VSRRAEIAQADAIAAEILTPEAARKIEEAIVSINAGSDQRLVLRLLYGMAYMDGMLAMAKVGVPQQ
jgi:hypothetical protein